MNNDQAGEDIDYLHPEGKPETGKPETGKPADGERFDGRELEAASRRQKSTDIDVDGHHMCSAECRHDQKAKP